MKTIHSVSIVGMGALGLLYGKQIAKQCGDEAVCFVMDEKRYEKYNNQEFIINGETHRFPIVKATEAKVADLVIVAVKYTGLEAALELMEGCVGPETIIISVLNGISSEQIIAEKFGMNHVIYTVAQGMDAMKFGNELNYTRQGELHIGMTADTCQENYDALKAFFETSEIPYVEEEDIRYRLWSKFMLNVGVNQTCMVYRTTYAGVLAEGEANRTLISAMREVVALAGMEGVALTEKELNQYVELTKTLRPDGTPSMGQDRLNKTPSEVEMFAGTVIELAKKHGIHVPVNQFLYKRVMEIEKEY